MARRAAIRVVLAAVALFAPAACTPSSADRAGPTATVRTEPPRTTTTAPYAVPAAIDATYVNRVLAGLDAVMGDVTRMVVGTKTIPPEAYSRLRALYEKDARLQLALDIYQDEIRQGFIGFRAEPGNRVSTVSQFITIVPGCVFARISRDYRPVGTNSVSDETWWVALRPLIPERDPQGYNATTWAYAYEGFTATRGAPPDPCAS